MSAHFDDEDLAPVNSEMQASKPDQAETASVPQPPALIQIGPLDI